MRAMMSVLVICGVLAAACGAPSGDESATATDETQATIETEAERGSSPAASDQGPEAMVLVELNETCEENWCYGEFDYEFLALECAETNCQLFFRAERDDETFDDSVVFEYDQPLVEDGYLEAGNWERVNDAITDWELAQGAG